MKLRDIVIHDAAMRSTCQKRVTVCILFGRDKQILACESNRCEPPGSTCQRKTQSDEKAAYPATSGCNWTHAEIMALGALPADSRPQVAHIYGHDFPCPACEEALHSRGVENIEVFADWPDTGMRTA